MVGSCQTNGENPVSKLQNGVLVPDKQKDNGVDVPDNLSNGFLWGALHQMTGRNLFQWLQVNDPTRQQAQPEPYPFWLQWTCGRSWIACGPRPFVGERAGLRGTPSAAEF